MPPPPPPLTFEPATPADAAYLYTLTEATMRTHVEASGGAWDPVRIREHISRSITGGNCVLIRAGGLRIGTMKVEEHSTHLQLEQLYLAPEHQGRGIGTQILQSLMAKAATEGKPLRLRVLAANPARRLYERLGFVVTASTPERYFMEYQP